MNRWLSTLLWLCLVPSLGGCPPTIERLRLKVGVRVPEVAEVVWDAGGWQGRAIRLRPCPIEPRPLGWSVLPDAVLPIPADPDPAPWTIGLSEPVGLFAPDGYARGLAAPWCAIDLVGQGPLTLDGQGPQGSVSLVVDLPDLVAEELAADSHGQEPSEGVDPRSLLVQIGGEGWSEALAEIAAQGPVEVVPGGPDHDRLLELLLARVEVYIDRDDDLVVSGDDGEPWLVLRPLVPE